MKNMLDVENVSIQIQNQVILDHISFSLTKDCNLAIVGTGGSGKSSLLKALSGKIHYQGHIHFDLTLKNHVSYVPQQHSFTNRSNTSDMYYQQRFNALDADDALTVREVLGDAFAHQMLEFKSLDLTQNLDQPLLQLSNGEHKKVQLAKIMLHHPRMVLLDDPFSGLDKKSRADLHQYINDKISQGICIILVTSPAEIPSGIDKVLQLDNGRMIAFQDSSTYKAIPTASKSVQDYNLDSILQLHPTQVTERFDSFIKMKDVTICYGDKKILHQISLDIKQGEKWLMIGHNGSGKSTLLSLILGDNPQAYANTIILFDHLRGTGESIWDIKKRIGYLSPELHMYFDKSLTVFQTIASGWFDTIGLFKRMTPIQHQIAIEWIKIMNLYEVKDHSIARLSFGQQRMVLLLRALVKSPSLLVLDEPLQGLSEEQQKSVLGLIDQWSMSDTKSLIFVSHYPEVRPRCIDHYMRLDHGNIVESNRIHLLI